VGDTFSTPEAFVDLREEVRDAWCFKRAVGK
jgi:hypothetical protein